ININYLTDSGEYEVPVILSVNEELLSLDPLEIKVVPEEVKVKVEKKMFNGVPVVPTISGIPQHGYEITSCKVTPELVPVTGPESVIKKTSQLVTEMIDVTDIRSSKVYKAKLKNMNKLIKPEEEVEYEVEVTVEPIIMERKFEGVPVRFINLAPSLVVTTPTPAVDFTLQGPMPLLEKYVTNLDTVKIDLSAVSDAGVYALPVIFNLPKDSVIIGQNDFVFEISVANKELEDKEVILEEGTVL
ncbi:MAG: YbbR-like domain-containing protein, partial [Treponema sp.]|nr:YbbR-like domain-containing protein [Treponema sp.]